mgnify:CR=1 FL=1
MEAIAVFSEADRGMPYLRLADQSICIGPAAATDSYLKITNIISAAEVADVDAIHPGYGFLAENAHFAEVCRSCNIEFIGPPHEAMAKLGDKVTAREIAAQANVHVTPGSDGLVTSDREAMEVAARIGYPVLIKAVAGGGGKGMRRVDRPDGFIDALEAAKSEALGAFGNDAVLIEKYIETPRHIEVQVFGDGKGKAVHLGERDCSLQRRHQKVIEEAPAPGMTEEMREAIRGVRHLALPRGRDPARHLDVDPLAGVDAAMADPPGGIIRRLDDGIRIVPSERGFELLNELQAAFLPDAPP